MQEVVARFENQGETQRHLEELKSENEREIARLTEERDRLQSDFTEKRYSGEAKLSRLLSEFTLKIIGSAKFRNWCYLYLPQPVLTIVLVIVGKMKQSQYVI